LFYPLFNIFFAPYLFFSTACLKFFKIVFCMLEFFLALFPFYKKIPKIFSEFLILWEK